VFRVQTFAQTGNYESYIYIITPRIWRLKQVFTIVSDPIKSNPNDHGFNRIIPDDNRLYPTGVAAALYIIL